uniref:Peroxisome assembly protein 12 n=1 Tax=Panagrellus redivivus TaxID=6233 RepID=A0A7E4W5U1_PANRE
MAVQTGAFRGAGVVSATTEATLPSVFDIWAQQSLSDSIKPALNQVVNFTSLWYPKKCQNIKKYFDELYLGFSFILDGYYLRNYGGSFAENFYGIKRIDSKTNKPPVDKNRMKSMFFITIWPYLRAKLDKLHERLTAISDQQRTRFTTLFLKYYPYLKTVIGIATVIFQLAYVFNFAKTPAPFLWLAGCHLEKLTPADLMAFDTLPLHLQSGGPLTRLWRFIVSIPAVFGRLFTYGLFFVQFLEYFYASGTADQFSTTHQRGSPPKHPAKRLTEAEVLTLEVDKCPLCYRRRVNDTVLAVSGYVFCFSCIDGYVRREGLCPVTYLPATVNELVRLYKTT